MQNVDFSSRIARQNSWQTPVQAVGTPAQSSPTGNATLSGKGLLALVAAVAFVLGIAVGAQFRKIGEIEQGIVRYPEKPKEGNASPQQSFANIAPTEEQPAVTQPHAESETASVTEGRFIIKIGTYRSADAEKITSELNNDPQIAQIQPKECRGVKESVPGRYLAFRSRAGQAENVFLGCFGSETEAEKMLQLLRGTSLPGRASARLFEIE